MVKNFLFHRVSPMRDQLWDPMDVRLFEKCIRYICDNHDVVLLEDIALDSDYGSRNKRLATVVFDDGYKDNVEYALPILEKFHVKSSFYVVTDCIEKNVPTWTYVLDYILQHTSNTKVNLAFDFLPRELQAAKLNSTQQRIAYARKLKPWLKKISHIQRVVVMETFQSHFADVTMPSMMMNWEDLRQLKNGGHYIGSHTVTHGMLGTMDSEKDIERELCESRQKIEEHLGYFPETISYPVGSYNRKVMELSRAAGYRLGLAVNQIPFNPTLHNSFEIPRIELYNEPWIKTRLRIDDIYGRISKLLRPV